MSIARILNYMDQLDDPRQGLFQRTAKGKWSVLKIFVQSLAATSAAGGATPVDMVLFCPACGLQHVDAPEPAVKTALDPNGVLGWPNPPHRSHLCHGCGYIWRPADVPTNGVKAIKTVGKADSPIRAALAAQSPAEAELRHHKQLLADTLGKVLVAAGVVRADHEGFTGPQLVQFGEELADAMNAVGGIVAAQSPDSGAGPAKDHSDIIGTNRSEAHQAWAAFERLQSSSPVHSDPVLTKAVRDFLMREAGVGVYRAALAQQGAQQGAQNG